MTTRQRNLGVTAYGLEQLKKGNYMADNDSFLAWMSTVKKGEYRGRDILQKMYDKLSKMSGLDATFTDSDFFQFQCMCRGLSATHPKYFYYTDTLGLDNLTIR